MLKRIVVALALVASGTSTQAGALGPPFKVNGYTEDAQHNSEVAPLKNGGFAVAWASFGQDGSHNGIFARIYRATGGPRGTEFQVNTKTSSNQNIPSIAGLRDGGFVVTWQSSGNALSINGQRYDATGQRIGDEFRINTTDGPSPPSVAGLADGGFIVVWFADGFGTKLVLAQRFNAAGLRQGKEFEVAATYADGKPRVSALSEGGFVVVWNGHAGADDEIVHARRYDANGVGDAVKEVYALESQTGDYGILGAGVAGLSDGSYVIIWEEKRRSEYLVAQKRYSAGGKPMGPRLTVKSGADDSVIAPLANGGFVVAYISRRGLTGQRFKANGTPVGSEFRASSTPHEGNGRHSLAVAGLSKGGFIVTWTQVEEDIFSDRTAIYGQHFNP